MNKTEIFLIILGLFCVVSGWFLGHADKIHWVQQLFVSEYIVASNVCNKMIEEDSFIKYEDPGFNQISEIISDELKSRRTDDFAIIKIEVAYSCRVGSHNEPDDSIITSFKVTMSDEKTETLSIENFRQKLKERYFDIKFFGWGAVIFWFGLVIEIILFIKKFLAIPKKI